MIIDVGILYVEAVIRLLMKKREPFQVQNVKKVFPSLLAGGSGAFTCSSFHPLR